MLPVYTLKNFCRAIRHAKLLIMLRATITDFHLTFPFKSKMKTAEADMVDVD